ncbi:hypothetical protein [Streptomyces sp. NPDC057253]|uniref:hypothetical protein n=1 Tax=Streptomyces sp. NPDC057253 TaxID=3346069 RepID=UPI003635E4F0
MDPVSVGLLVALAGGAGGELGREVWAGLSALVRRPFRRGDVDPPAIGTGESELTRLAQDPSDESAAQTLSTTLSVRAALDPDFRTALTAWHGQARQVRIEDHTVHNTISGGTQHGPVLQGGSFTNLTFTQAPAQGGDSDGSGCRTVPNR